MFGAMIAALVVLGFWPQPLIVTARQTVTGLQEMTAASTLAQPQDAAETGGPAAAAEAAAAQPADGSTDGVAETGAQQ